MESCGFFAFYNHLFKSTGFLSVYISQPIKFSYMGNQPVSFVPVLIFKSADAGSLSWPHQTIGPEGN